jgi:hypothetical protein
VASMWPRLHPVYGMYNLTSCEIRFERGQREMGAVGIEPTTSPV